MIEKIIPRSTFKLKSKYLPSVGVVKLNLEQINLRKDVDF